LVLSTDSIGNGAIVVAVSQNLAGQSLTATATAQGTYVETSEFGPDYPVMGMMMAMPGPAGAPASPVAPSIDEDGSVANQTDSRGTPLQTVVKPNLEGAAAGASGQYASAVDLVFFQELRSQQPWTGKAVAAGVAATDVLDQFFANPA
jgi:hypothetical protein